MSQQLQLDRVPHPRRGFIAAGWGVARSTTALLFIIASAGAQETLCGISSLDLSHTLTYPPIARAAHITGSVIMLVTFAPNGAVVSTKILSGPKFLSSPVESAVHSSRANPYAGPRECPFVVRFELTGPENRECDIADAQSNYVTKSPSVKALDLQHVEVTAENGCINVIRDPSPQLIHRKHFLIF